MSAARSQSEIDFDDLVTLDGKGKVAKVAALKRLTSNTHAELLSDILSVLEKRAIGHSIMYSDRLLPFVPRIRALIDIDKPDNRPA